VAYLFKTRTVEPDKQPLLANGSEIAFVSRQRPRNKHVSTATNQHATTEVPLETVFSTMVRVEELQAGRSEELVQLVGSRQSPEAEE
jgi:hypothetical protein